MNYLLKYIIPLLLIQLINKSAKAQHYENIYQAVDADMLQVQGNNRIEHTLKGATIILPNGSSQLTVTLNIPYNEVDNNSATTGFSPPDLLFNLKINIDRLQIQEVLTSTKTFVTHGSLALNSITKAVAVQYTPMLSGTEENGNFNIYMSVQFNPADFNLDVPDSNALFVIKINNAKVNRI
jgi:hypothetical protein